VTRMPGVALPVVLWTVAALSLLLGNLVQFARVEVQMSSAHLMQMQADALRMGGVKYVSQSLRLKGQTGDMPPLSGALQIDEKPVQFELVNAAGLIDLNFADDRLLGLLLQRALNWTPERVLSVIEMRRKRTPLAFPSLRDAQRLLDLTPDEWAALMPLVTVHSGASGVNVYVAPAQVLGLLRPDNSRAVLAFEQARRNQGKLADLTLIDSPFHQSVSVTAFRLDVSVTLPDGRSWPRRYWLINADQPAGGWRVADHQSLPGS
jgi:type II secretory pathway component PulK